MKEIDEEERELDEWFEKFFSEGRMVGVMTAEEALEKGITSNNPENSEKYFSETIFNDIPDPQLDRLVREAWDKKKRGEK